MSGDTAARIQGLRLGAEQEKRLRAWPKDRIRPKSVALGLISLLAEIDALRVERDVLRAQLDDMPLVSEHEDARAEAAIMSAADAYRLVDEARQMRHERDAALAENTELRAVGEQLYVELNDAAFGYEGVHWKVVRDAQPALEAWRAIRQAGAGGGEGE